MNLLCMQIGDEEPSSANIKAFRRCISSTEGRILTQGQQNCNNGMSALLGCLLQGLVHNRVCLMIDPRTM